MITSAYKLIGIALRYTELIPSLPFDKLDEKVGELLNNVQYAEEITEHYLVTKGEEIGFSSQEIRDLIALTNVDGIRTLDEAKAAFANYLSELSYQYKKQDFDERLKKARAFLKKNNVNEAIELIKDIKFTRPKPLPSTIELMQHSLLNTGQFWTGYKNVDQAMNGFSLGNVLSVTGDTGSQKTRFTLHLMLKILITNKDFTCLFFEKEMPAKDISNYLTSFIIRRATNWIKVNPKASQKLLEEQLEKPEVKSLVERFMIVPNTDFANANDMYKIIEHYEPQLWALDYMSQLSGEGNDVNSKILEQAEQLKEIVRMTNSFGTIINQTRKEGNYVRPNRIPEENDAEYSGRIKQISAYHLVLFYPWKYYSGNPNMLQGITLSRHHFYAIFKKSRDSEAGTKLFLHSEPEFCSFKEEPLYDQWLYSYINSI